MDPNFQEKFVNGAVAPNHAPGSANGASYVVEPPFPPPAQPMAVDVVPRRLGTPTIEMVLPMPPTPERTGANDNGEQPGGINALKIVSGRTSPIEATILRALMVPNNDLDLLFGAIELQVPGERFPVKMPSVMNLGLYNLCLGIRKAGGFEAINDSWLNSWQPTDEMVWQAAHEIVEAWRELGTPCTGDVAVAKCDGVKWMRLKRMEWLFQRLREISEHGENPDFHFQIFHALEAKFGMCVDKPLFANLSILDPEKLANEKPTIAEVVPGKHLLYAGRINEIHGEPSVGKTNIALQFARSILQAGGSVIYIDPEDTAISAVTRLSAFGVPWQEIVRGFHHHQADGLTPNGWTDLVVAAERIKPALVVIDGVAEILAALGLDENTPKDFLEFASLVDRFKNSGAALLLTDHVVKSSENRGRWSRGSGAKLGRYDGAVYSLEMVQAYSPIHAGCVRLKVAKDRNGGVGVAGQTVGEFRFEPDGRLTQVRFVPESPLMGGEFVPTAVMEKISIYLEDYNQGLTVNEIRAAKFAGHDTVRRALRSLTEQRYVEIKHDKKKHLHFSRQPFREKEFKEREGKGMPLGVDRAA